MKRALKAVVGGPLTLLLRASRSVRRNLARIHAHASLAADLARPLPASVVVMGKVDVHGSGNIDIGEDVLLYPDIHLETQGAAQIVIGKGCVISRGAHIVAMSGVTIGDGAMIGEYAGIRDANHLRSDAVTIRDAGHSAKPIAIGNEAWIGRNATVLGGVSIGEKATVGANAVVTKDIAPRSVAVGVPAAPMRART